MNIWALANQKGGVGKTTSAVTLAGILASRNEETLMIDLDPHASLSSYFGLEPENVNKSVYDLFADYANGNKTNLDTVVHKTEINHLSIIPSSSAVATLEKQFGSKNGMGLMLSQVLKAAENKYQHVLIDCPPVLGMLMLNALVACDRLIVPVQTEMLAIKGLHRMLHTLEMIEHSLHKKIDYTILPTMYDKRTLASQKSLQILHDEYKELIFDKPIPVDTKFRDASFIGKPLSFVNKNTHGLKAYEYLLKKILDVPANQNRDVA